MTSDQTCKAGVRYGIEGAVRISYYDILLDSSLVLHL